MALPNLRRTFANMLTARETEAAKLFVERMLNWTLRLINVEPAKDDDRFASGVLVRIGTRFVVLSAGHALRKGKWVIETNVGFWPPKTYVFCVPKAHVFYSSVDDFAWAELNVAQLTEQIRRDLTVRDEWFELFWYGGRLDHTPDRTIPYGFASWKAVEFLAGLHRLDREPRYEIHMKYDGLDKTNGLYRFLLSRAHQGHDYYYGCSGSPIADVYGNIVSLVVSSPNHLDEEVIFGTPLAKYLPDIPRA